MPETQEAVRERLQKSRDKQLRKAVSRKLTLYHQELLNGSPDSLSFFEHVMEQARRPEHQRTRYRRVGY